RIRAADVVPLVAREHTAQIPNDVRLDIENDFKASVGQSPVNLLSCSPTLEMGIDVGGLDAVVLRNVPPRPDNYAQRGGRAGRRSRIGMVVGYARSTPHDQYFYDKPREMIAGEVPAPAVNLGNPQLTEAGLRQHLSSLPEHVRRVFDCTARQVIELRTALERYAEQLQGRHAGVRAADLVARLLGIPSDQRRQNQEADDRSAG